MSHSYMNFLNALQVIFMNQSSKEIFVSICNHFESALRKSNQRSKRVSAHISSKKVYLQTHISL